MPELFADNICVVAPDNSCDVCGMPAGYYSTFYYIHICSEKCFNIFEANVNEELSRISPIVRLNPDKTNGEKNE